MSHHTQTNPSSTRPGVGTRIKGVFQTAHGVGENIRGRALGTIDDMTNTGSSESKSRYSSIADRGRMEAETGMARVYGYPDPNATNVLHNEHGHPPQTNAGILGNGHTTGSGPGTGYPRPGESDYDRGGGVDGGVGRRDGAYGTDDGYGQPGVQNTEYQQPTIDGNTGMEPDPKGLKTGLSPNRGPENTGSEAGWSIMSQDGALTPTQQRIKRDFPPELPLRPQAQAANNDQTTQMHQ